MSDLGLSPTGSESSFLTEIGLSPRADEWQARPTNEFAINFEADSEY